MSTPPQGWAGPEAAKRANEELAHLFPPFLIQGQSGSTAGRRVALWEPAKKLLGAHVPTLYQQIGDCVSMAGANAADYLSAADIVVRGDAERFRHAFMPYLYGTSRVLVGNQRGSYQDGSLGVWLADAVRKHGILWADHEGVPAYSAAIAKDWGAKGPPKAFVDHAAQFPIRTTAKVRTYEQARDALCNHYPVVVCSDRGFRMAGTVSGDKLWGTPSGTWRHAMVYVAVDDDPKRPGVYCLNSWGPDAHGRSPDGAPPGGFWVDAEVADYMLRQDDSYAYSDLVGFPERRLNYMLI